MKTPLPFLRLAALPVVASALLAHPAQAQVNYVALGDSYAFGYQTASTVIPGNGNAPLYGYVGTSTGAGKGTNTTFAGYLANQLGQNVNVTNLAIPGETTYAYLGQATPAYVPTHSIAANTNYTSSTQTQQGVFDALAKNSANVITLELGGNDVIDYLYYEIATGQTITNANINAVESVSIANMATIINDLKARDSSARILVAGYADPFPGITSANSTATTLNGFDVYATQSYNALLQNLAASTGVGYVGFYNQFVGHEAAYTYINDPTQNTPTGPLNVPDYHPNSTGYGVIANQFEGAFAAPEPSSVALLSSVLLGGIATGIRRRRRG